MGMRAYFALGGTLALALLLGGLYWWGNTGWSKYHHIDAKYQTVLKQVGVVTVALQNVSENSDLKWETVPGQIMALGTDIRNAKQTIENLNNDLETRHQESVRLKARAAELQEMVAKAKAQRVAALRRLGDLSISPGTRADCELLLREANEALDIAIKEGV